jgi:hypothetical protein
MKEAARLRLPVKVSIVSTPINAERERHPAFEQKHRLNRGYVFRLRWYYLRNTSALLDGQTSTTRRSVLQEERIMGGSTATVIFFSGYNRLTCPMKPPGSYRVSKLSGTTHRSLQKSSRFSGLFASRRMGKAAESRREECREGPTGQRQTRKWISRGVANLRVRGHEAPLFEMGNV